MVCLVSMLPMSRGQRVTYCRTALVFLQIHIGEFQHFAFSKRLGEERGSLAFEGDSVAADGHDGIVHIVLSLQRRVDVHHLKVHRNTAEPAEQSGSQHEEPFSHSGLIGSMSY